MPIRFRTNIQLAPSDLVADFEQVMLDHVKSSLEGVCSRYGYIRPGSIQIIKRSVGTFIKQHFNGHIKFDMVCKAEVCNPAIGAIFKATVKNKNALGIHAESSIENDGVAQPVLDIIIPKRSAGITSTIDLDSINIGDIVHVEVLGKRYQLHDKKISIIGRAVSDAPQQQAPTDVLVVKDDEDMPNEQQVDTDALEDDEDEDKDSSEGGDDDGETDSDDDDKYTHKGGEDAEDEEEILQEEFVEDDMLSEDEDADDEYDNDDEY